MYFKILILLIFLASCGEDPSSNGEVVLPSNLEVVINQDSEDPAKVQVNVSADNANFYRFYFGENDDFIEQKEEEIDYTYSAFGEFNITVQAHVTSTDFISYTEKITVPEPDPSDYIPDTGYDTPESYDGMTLVWQDEFDGGELSDDWTFEIGDGCPDLCGWGNAELEYYKEENTSIVDGNLVITAKEENAGGRNYTSSRIITKGQQSFQYGRIDIRAVLPNGQGIWPALWMLGSNIDEVGWPACGEIDIMELVGGNVHGGDNTVHGTVHWSNDGEHASYGGDYALNSGIFSDEFHVFSLVWDEEKIEWYVDDNKFHEIDITPAELSEFRDEFFFIFNIAVGGNFPGNPDASTTFPQRMIVDYIRVFQPD